MTNDLVAAAPSAAREGQDMRVRSFDVFDTALVRTWVRPHRLVSSNGTARSLLGLTELTGEGSIRFCIVSIRLDLAKRALEWNCPSQS